METSPGIDPPTLTDIEGVSAGRRTSKKSDERTLRIRPNVDISIRRSR
jgi:hypothetical protein